MLRKADGTLIEKQVGQKAMAESLPVVLASDQSDLPVTLAGEAVSVSGVVTVNATGQGDVPITLAGEAVIIGGQPISVNAAITGQPISTNIAASDSAGIDAFGRWRTSGTGNRYDSEYIYNKQPLLVDEVISGGATATHNADSRDVTLAIVNATNATSAAHYSHIDVPYTPGNSQLVDSGMEFDVAATAISGGVRVASDYFVTGRNVSNTIAGTLGRLTMALGRTGTSDILTLAAIRTGTNNSSAFGAMSWREIK